VLTSPPNGEPRAAFAVAGSSRRRADIGDCFVANDSGVENLTFHTPPDPTVFPSNRCRRMQGRFRTDSRASTNDAPPFAV
jgi:hypothetical protein